MLKLISQLFKPDAPEALLRKQLLEARRALVQAELDLDWAQAKCNCLRASIDRLKAQVPVKASHKDDWLTVATFD